MSLYHAKHAKSDDHDDPSATLLAVALIRSREAIVGTEVLTATAPPPQPAPGIARLPAELRLPVLRQELTEGLTVTASAGQAQLTCQGGPLVTITAPKPKALADAVEMVGHYAELRADRLAEIEVQRGPLIPFFAAIHPLEPARDAATLEALACALEVATPLIMRLKLALACPRPAELSPGIQPMIASPGHPAYPSGHATQAFCLAALLTRLIDPEAPFRARDPLFLLAARIAVNRTVAGVHYPVDSAAGAVLGLQIAEWLWARGQPEESLQGAGFDGNQWMDGTRPRDFHPGTLEVLMGWGDPVASRGDPFTPPQAPLWSELLDRAVKEREAALR